MAEQLFAGRIDITPGDRVRVPDETAWVQFSHALTDKQHRALGKWFSRHPGATLRAYGNYSASISDLQFLRHYPSLRGFQIDSIYRNLPDTAGLRHLPDDLRYLHLGVPTGDDGEELLDRSTKLEQLGIALHKRLPRSIRHCSTVRSLYLEGPVKDLEALRPLTGVTDLTLRSVTVPNLDAIFGMTTLRSLDIKLGGIRNLDDIPRFQELRYLELWMIRGLTDVSFLGALHSLEHLKLESLKNVKTLPSLAALQRLKVVDLQNMKGLSDLTPVASAPALETLWLVNASHLQPDVVHPFVGHPTLQRARLGFGSLRKNEKARALLRLPDA